MEAAAAAKTRGNNSKSTLEMMKKQEKDGFPY